VVSHFFWFSVITSFQRNAAIKNLHQQIHFWNDICNVFKFTIYKVSTKGHSHLANAAMNDPTQWSKVKSASLCGDIRCICDRQTDRETLWSFVRTGCIEHISLHLMHLMQPNNVNSFQSGVIAISFTLNKKYAKCLTIFTARKMKMWCKLHILVWLLTTSYFTHVQMHTCILLLLVFAEIISSELFFNYLCTMYL